MLSNIVLFSNDCLRKLQVKLQCAICCLCCFCWSSPENSRWLCAATRDPSCGHHSIRRGPHRNWGTGGHMGDTLIQQEHSDSDESLLTRSQDKHYEWHYGLKKKLFCVNCLSHQYLNVNSPCQCRSVLKWRQTLRGPRLFTAETLSMRQKIGKLNRTQYYLNSVGTFCVQVMINVKK